MLTNEIKALADNYEDAAISVRRMLHRIPETEFEEFKTSGYIASVLDTLSIPYRRGFAGGTGICAAISGKERGRCVAIRADIDALPVTEETHLPFASEHEGKMHACGHDAHAAIALCTAFILNELRDNIKGNVKILFQPAEEGEGGAERMIAEGVLDSPIVDVCIGGHVMSEYETGKIIYKKGPLMASPDNFEAVIRGAGGHGAYPEKCINPIAAAAAAVEKITKLTDMSVPRVVSVCTITGGACPNVIPSEVKISGTARTFTPDARSEASRLIEEAIRSAAAPFGAEYEYRFIPLFPALINDCETTDLLAEAARKIVGEENVVETQNLSMAGDDFSYFARALPSSYIHIGCRNEEIGAVYPLHSPKFMLDERCIKIAAMCYAQFAVDYLNYN